MIPFQLVNKHFKVHTSYINSSPLDSLVSAGTITQDQADAVQSVFQSRGKEIQASGTYSNKTKPQNPLESLVTAGTITQEQKDEIQSTFRSDEFKQINQVQRTTEYKNKSIR